MNWREFKIESAYLALSKVADGELPMAPNPTPTAKPSGMLCTVIAMTRSIMRFHWLRCISSMFDTSSKVCAWVMLSEFRALRPLRRYPSLKPSIVVASIVDTVKLVLISSSRFLSFVFVLLEACKAKKAQLVDEWLGHVWNTELTQHHIRRLQSYLVNQRISTVYETCAKQKPDTDGNKRVFPVLTVNFRFLGHFDTGRK